jgi:hypothetical protein
MVAGSGAYPLVLGNTFQKNLQSLSSDGYARSGYVAVANLFMGGNGSVDADVHGPNGIPKDTGHDGGISGLAAQVVGNTFLHADGGGRHANFCLRGLPCSGVTVTFKGNVTVQSVGDSVTLIPPDKIPPVGSSGSNCIPWPEARPRVPYMSVDSKFSIADPMQTFLVGNFDGDTKDDVFMATGAAWYYSPGGNAEWRFLSAKTETTDELLIGDFDGDGRADVFKASGDDWFVSWGGRSDWQLLSTHHRVNMTKPDYGTVGFVIGDFVSDNGADVFFADGQTWWLSEAGVGPFQPYATSSCNRPSLVFGKFDQSGKMEPACVVDGQWMYAPSQAPHEWTPLRSALTQTMNSVVVADFKGDGISDIAYPAFGIGSNSPLWMLSVDGRDDPFPVEFLQNLPSAIARGHFSDDHPGADLLSWQGNYWALTSYYVGSPQRQSRQDMR